MTPAARLANLLPRCRFALSRHRRHSITGFRCLFISSWWRQSALPDHAHWTTASIRSTHTPSPMPTSSTSRRLSASFTSIGKDPFSLRLRAGDRRSTADLGGRQLAATGALRNLTSRGMVGDRAMAGSPLPWLKARRKLRRRPASRGCAGCRNHDNRQHTTSRGASAPWRRPHPNGTVRESISRRRVRVHCGRAAVRSVGGFAAQSGSGGRRHDRRNTPTQQGSCRAEAGTRRAFIEAGPEDGHGDTRPRSHRGRRVLDP
jgi:hypothetical protein